MFSSNPLTRIALLVVVVTIALSIFGLIVWRGGVIFGLSLKFKTIVLLSFGLIWLLVASMALSSTPRRIAEIIGIVVLALIYAIWVLSPVLIVSDLVSIWYKIPPVIIGIISVIWLWIWVYYGTATKVTELSLTSKTISHDAKIVFISDIHVEAIHNTRYIQSIVTKIQALQPDFVLLGGDLMNTAKSDYVDAFLPFNQLKMPVYATLGNHDNMWDANAISGIFATTKIIPLRNKSIDISWIQIVGIDDKSYRSGKTLTEILDESKISSGAKYTILISHQPQKLSKLDWYPIDLELAGHTHNGQFVPLTWMIWLFNDYAYGKYTDWKKTAFVSQWIGTWWGPLRIGTQSELVLIILKKSH